MLARVLDSPAWVARACRACGVPGPCWGRWWSSRGDRWRSRRPARSCPRPGLDPWRWDGLVWHRAVCRALRYWTGRRPSQTQRCADNSVLLLENRTYKPDMRVIVIYLYTAVMCILLSVGLSRRSWKRGLKKNALKSYQVVRNDEKRILFINVLKVK